jgi:hypothetical protein
MRMAEAPPPRPSPAPAGERGRAWSLAIAGLTALAALLQAARFPYRWNQVAIAYAAYQAEWRNGIRAGGLLAALDPVGLHPPGFSFLFAPLLTIDAAPAAWFLLSGTLSVLAVPLLAAAGRRPMGEGPALLAAALLAVSPHRNAYGLEPNNYPLAVFALALQGWAFVRWLERPASRGRLGGLAAATALLAWTHALCLAQPLGQLVVLLRSERLRGFALAAGLAAAASLPLLPGALGSAASDPVNPPAGLGPPILALLTDLPGRYGSRTAAFILGGLGLAGVVAAAAGRRGVRNAGDVPTGADGGGSGGTADGGDSGDLRSRRQPGDTHPGGDGPGCFLPSAAATLGISCAAILALQSAGVASAEQHPYWLIPLPSLCLLAASMRGGALRALLAVALTLHLAVQSAQWLHARGACARSASEFPRVADAVAGWSPGSTLLLLLHPSGGDDAKDALDPAWTLIPATTGLAFEEAPGPVGVLATDPYWGLPVRASGDRWLWAFPTLATARWDAVLDAERARGRSVHVAAWGFDPRGEDWKVVRDWAARHGLTGGAGERDAGWRAAPR